MNTAMILCAGFGTRMNEYTRTMPKPMLPLKGRPMLDYTITHLGKVGIQNIIINLHYLPDQITSYFANGEKWGVAIKYSYEEQPLGTAGAVKKVEALLEKTDNFMVLYGDIICNQDYSLFIKAHVSKPDAVATIMLHERNKSNSVVEMDALNRITRFIERPKEEVKDKKQNWVNSGIYCFKRQILDSIPEKTFSDFPKDIFPDLLANGNLYGYPLDGYRCAVDSPERYERLKLDFETTPIF